jgi:hypothetical protein
VGDKSNIGNDVGCRCTVVEICVSVHVSLPC